MTNEPTRERIEKVKQHAEEYLKMYKGALIDLDRKVAEHGEMFLEGEFEAEHGHITRGIENYETFLTLANAELERQSVRSKDIETAIGTAERMAGWFKDKCCKDEDGEIYLEYIERNAPLMIDALKAYKKGDNHDD